MKTIQQALIEEIYMKADKLAKENRQSNHPDAKFVTLNKSEYFITLQQLMDILKEFED